MCAQHRTNRDTPGMFFFGHGIKGDERLAEPAMACWLSLPTELKLQVIADLAPDDVDALAQSCLASYRACVPARFRVCSYHRCLSSPHSFLVHKPSQLFFSCSFPSERAPQLLCQH